jgi:hypothetical protein
MLRELSSTIPPEEGGGALITVYSWKLPVFEGEQRAALAHICDQFTSHFSVVEVLGICGDAAECAGQLGLTEGLALFVELPVKLEDAFRVREESQVGVAEFMSLFGGQLKAFSG